MLFLKKKRNHFLYKGEKYEALLLCDLMHLEGAKELAAYQEDFYADTPVITMNEYGEGRAFYVGTRSSKDFYKTFLRERMEEKGIRPALETPERGRGSREVKRRCFLSFCFKSQ